MVLRRENDHTLQYLATVRECILSTVHHNKHTLGHLANLKRPSLFFFTLSSLLNVIKYIKNLSIWLAYGLKGLLFWILVGFDRQVALLHGFFYHGHWIRPLNSYKSSQNDTIFWAKIYKRKPTILYLCFRIDALFRNYSSHILKKQQ